MSLADLREAMTLVKAEPSRSSFAGPRYAKLIAWAETLLRGNFPPSYREFIAALGAGNFGAFEVYGLIDYEYENSSVPNGLWLTMCERGEASLPGDLFIIGSSGDGDYYCVRLGTSESPVILFRPGLPGEEQRYETVAPDFGAFFLEGIHSQIARY